MTERTVAFIDILGFKKKVQTRSAEELGTEFTKILGGIIPKMNGKLDDLPNELTFLPNFQCGEQYCISFVFSDSIILISNDDSEESCLALLLYSLRVSQLLIGNDFPIRGAITFGDMYVDIKNSFFLGKALTHAYELEQGQNWVGLVIDDSVPSKFPNVLTSDIPTPGLRPKLFPKYKVPMKSGPIKSLHTLNWRWNWISPKGIKHFFKDPEDRLAKVKIDAALDYALEMRKRNLAGPINDKSIPMEVGPIYIKEVPSIGEPPKHGDEY